MQGVWLPFESSLQCNNEHEIENKHENPHETNRNHSFLFREEERVMLWFYNANISINCCKSQDTEGHKNPVICKKTSKLAKFVTKGPFA